MVLAAVGAQRKNGKNGHEAPAANVITLNAASQKYGIPVETIKRWTVRGDLGIRVVTPSTGPGVPWIIDEDTLVPVIERYKAGGPKRGRRHALTPV